MEKILNEWKKFLEEGSGKDSKLSAMGSMGIANMIRSKFEADGMEEIPLQGLGNVEGVLYQTPGPFGTDKALVAAVKLNIYNMLDKKSLKREVAGAQEDARTILATHLPGVQGKEEMKWDSKEQGFFLPDSWEIKERGKDLSPYDGEMWAVVSAYENENK